MTLNYNPDQYTIAELVPHSAPMILLESVQKWTETSVEATVVINSSSPFASSSGVPAYVGIEYMAQAISAQAGTWERLQNAPVQIGFLVGSRRYNCNVQEFPLGAQLTVSIVESLRSETGLSVYDCRIEGEFDGEQILADASLNVFQPDNAENFLGENT